MKFHQENDAKKAKWKGGTNSTFENPIAVNALYIHFGNVIKIFQNLKISRKFEKILEIMNFFRILKKITNKDYTGRL